MLKTILSVSGKPGLFKLISNGKNMVIVESLSDKRRMPIYARDRVVSLGDIAMYTDDDEVPLSEILLTIEIKENGSQASISPTSKPEELRKYFSEILPNYDRDRVYDSDIKKLLNWYNMLINCGYSFKEDEKQEEIISEPELVETESKRKTTTKKAKSEKEEVKEETETAPKKTKPAAKKEK